MMIEFQIDARDLERAAKQISFFPKLYEKSARQAMTRALTAMKNKMAQSVSERYYMSGAEVKYATKIEHLLLKVRGPILSPADYYLSPKRLPKGRQRGLKIGIMKRGGVKNIPRGFLVRFSSGVVVPYVRYKRSGGNHWKGIKPLYAPAIPQIVKNPEVLNETQKRGAEIFERTFKHEVYREMGMIKS